eukprot:3068405-Alexandrium_andersonii.AAC.1
MSASLVGSEMCIRDRPRSASPVPQAPFSKGPVQQRPRSTEPCSAGPVPPVSYTHLTLPTICSV